MNTQWMAFLTLSLFVSMSVFQSFGATNAFETDKRKTVSTWTYKRLAEVQEDLEQRTFRECFKSIGNSE